MTIDRTDPYSRLNPRPIPTEDYTREETYRHTRAPVDLAVTLIPDAYTSREFFEIEREKVFAASWVVVGFTSQIEEPGQVIVDEVAGRSIIVTRDKQGELRAFYNVCRHRSAKLLDDGTRVVRNNRIRCPYHSWTYDLGGKCLGTPLFEGSDIPEEARAAFDMSGVRGFDKADYGLLPVKVESWGFLIFVNLDPDAAPLTEQLGDLPDRFSDYRLDPNHAFIIVANPVGPDRTVEETVILSHPESLDNPDAEKELDQLMRFWDLVNLQDIEIVERVQEGISNPAYRGGRMCYQFEETLHRYQNIVIDKMVGVDRIPPGDQEESVRMFRSNGSVEGN